MRGTNMSSVDYKKLKTKADAAALIRHCDETERLKHEHANKEIDKTQTYKNKNLFNLNYKETIEKLKARIDFLDKTTNTNKRKDRVEAFSLCITAAESMTDSTAEKFLEDALEIIMNTYKKENIINAYTHFDEIHEYVDDFKIKKSRAHMHVYVVAADEKNSLNAKWFSSKKMMQRVNKDIDEMCREKYNCSFLTREKAKKKTVEQLKDQTQDIKNLEKFNELLEKNLFEELRKMLKDKKIMKTVLAALEANREEKTRDMNEICR